MKKNIYIVEGCHITNGYREPYEYHFNLGCYATPELAQEGIDAEIAKLVTSSPKEWERKHERRVDFIKDGRVSDVWKFAINEIVYKF